jgi:aspartokinase-like uncharacterized kinase
VIVVKVGGSLYDHPRLGAKLRVYLSTFAPAEVLLVPGGGDVVEAVRKLDTLHGLGQEFSHELALMGMELTGRFLLHLLGKVTDSTVRVFAPHELNPNDLPHTWETTSDSIAARVALVRRAEQLVLLKSVDVPPGTPWEAAAARGWVDRQFPRVVAGLSFPVQVVNFRRVLDASD